MTIYIYKDFRPVHTTYRWLLCIPNLLALLMPLCQRMSTPSYAALSCRNRDFFGLWGKTHRHRILASTNSRISRLGK